MARKKTKKPPRELTVAHPLTYEQEIVLSGESPANIFPAKKNVPELQESDRRYLEIECPNCRAEAGQPCKWEDKTLICQARANVWHLRNPHKEETL